MSALTKEDIKILAAPFDYASIGVKIQSVSKDKLWAGLVCYIQHTDAYARIEQVDPAWAAEITHEEHVGDVVYVRLKMTIKGVSRENVGEGDDAKGATSDALKRTAMLFGVGRYLYDHEMAWVEYNESRDRYRILSYDDYKAALKGKPGLPPGKAPETNAPTPIRKPEETKAAPTATTKSRPSLIAEIAKTKLSLKLSDKEMIGWVYELYKKDLPKLTNDEMENFLGVLHGELGRTGVIVR